MSIIEKEYSNANFKRKDIPTFYDEVNVSILDIISENEVEVKSKNYSDCLCKSSTNVNEYFKECSKCNGMGTLVINKREFICNECKGEKYIRVRDCYLCHNDSKILLDSRIKIKLNNSYKHNDEITLDYKDYKLNVKLNVYDRDDYYIDNKDVYYLRLVDYSLNDFKNKKSVVINTIKGKEYVKSEFKCKREVVCLEGKGIEDGNFYFTFENEVENEKKIIYANVVITNRGYANLESLINDSYSIAKTNISLLEKGYIYIDEDTNKIETNEYVIHLNKLDANCFKEDDNKLVYDLYLDKEDNNTDKKALVINEEKINISYKKNLKEIQYVDIANKVLLDKMGKKTKMTIKVNPYFENIYRIKINKNKDTVYVEDYKRVDNKLVETFKKNKYLEDYIEINRESKLVVGNDLILIERV